MPSGKCRPLILKPGFSLKSPGEFKKKMLISKFHPRNSNLIGMENDLGSRLFKISLGNSTVSQHLRTTGRDRIVSRRSGTPITEVWFYPGDSL